MLLARLSRSRCHQVARVLQSYLDGEVEPPVAAMVAEHLEECRRCGLEADAYLAIKTAITSSAPDALDVDPAAVDRLRLFARQLAAAESDPDPGRS
jgi:anti-sigma factor RsiW